MKDKLKNPPEWAKNHPDFDKLDKIEVVSNIDTASVPYYSEPGDLADAASDAVKAVKGEKPVLNGSGGTTDGRFVQDYFPDAEIIELGLPERGGCSKHAERPADYSKKGGMHQIDERASLEDMVTLRDIFKETIKNYGHKQEQNHRKPTGNDNRRAAGKRRP